VTRKERRELQAIAAFLRSLEICWPTDPLQIVVQHTFMKWAVAVLEGRDPNEGRRTRASNETLEYFGKLTEELKTAQAKLVTEGKEDPSLTTIFERMSKRHFPFVEPDSLRRQRDRIKRQVGKSAAGEAAFDAALKNMLAEIEIAMAEFRANGEPDREP
jgi:hypothetical protein